MSDTRTALITGGGSGIGAAAARRLAARGMKVALLGRTLSKLEAVSQEIIDSGGPEPVLLAVHQEDETEVNTAIEAALEQLGCVDVLLNNAAIYEPGTTCDVGMDSWDRMLACNLRGPLLVSRAVVPKMRERGSGIIINNASTLGLKPVAGFSPYAVSKAALLMLTRCLALEEAANGIRVVAICPGVVDTPIHHAPDKGKAFLEEMAKFHPLGRVGTADEIAALVEFLASPDASWITGSIITIDGGISLS